MGEFEIVTELGRGGMAAVYLARDLALNRRVAIKVMAPGLLLGPGMWERFRQEAVTVANLQHAHIVSIHAVRQLEDLNFFVMQFVPGRTLEGVLRAHGALPIPVVRAWLYQIGSALGYAHRRGVIHRDIKPGNILLNADGEAVVTDFGIAKVAETPSHTQTGTVVGTPVYMSPEQCYARELTGASDQYSLGIVAYEMLAGRPPFSGSSFALMRSHTDEPPPPLHDIRADVPPSMEAALMRMLAKKTDDRFPTLAEALVSLGASPLSPDDPLHADLQQLAAASERLAELSDVLRTPASPVPKTRERPKAPNVVTPRAPVPATETIVVVIAPPPSDLEPGATTPLRATVKHATGQSGAAAELEWTSSAPSVVAVDARSGSLKAIAKGSAVVTAATGTARDSVEVQVGEPRAAQIAIAIPPGALTVGDRVTVSAVVTSRYGVRVARPVDWSVDEPTIAVVERNLTSAGNTASMIRGLSPGMTGVIASCDGAIGRATVRVVPAPVIATPTAPQSATPGEAQKPATPLASATEVLAPSRSTEPVSATTAPAQVSPVPVAPPPAPERVAPPREPAAAGRSRTKTPVWQWLVPVAAGAGLIAYFALKPSVATTGSGADTAAPGRRDSVTTTVVDTPATSARDSVRPDTSGALARDSGRTTRSDSVANAARAGRAVARRVEIRPARPALIRPGQTVALSASVRDSAGALMRNTPVFWASGDPRVATVDAAGTVRAVGAGATRVTVSVGSSANVTSGVLITVEPPPPDPTVVASIDVSDVRPMTVGETTRVTATARNAAGAPVGSATFDWTSSNPDVASISANGTITARAAGAATIRASSGGRTGERPVTVRAKEVATGPDTPSARNTNPSVKTEAELRTEIRNVLATYVRAIETRDTSLIRRVFPNAGSDEMKRWQTTFNDSRSGIQMSGAAPEILDTPRDAAGAQVRAHARYTARFSSRANRSDLSFPVEFTAVLQRDGGAWRITSIR